jgi:hypothetical protein
MSRLSLRGWQAGMLLVASLSACMPPMRVTFNPDPLSAPWDARKPKVYLGAVRDVSAGTIRQMNVAAFTPDVPLADTLRDSLTKEFQRLGVPLSPQQRGADARVDANWMAGEVQVDGLLPGSLMTATVKIKMTVRANDGETIFDDKLVGRASAKMPVMYRSLWEQLTSRALADAMKQVEDLFMGDLTPKIFAARKEAAQASRAPEAAVARSDVDDIPRTTAPPRKAYAVVVGIQTYQQQLPDADFAAADARLFGKYLTGVLGYPAKDVAVLVDDGASRGDIEKYIERWLPNSVGPDDSVTVYFSGHGAPNPVTGDAYLVPYDGDPAYLDQTAYPLSRLYASLAKLPSKDVTVVLDSCFSGAGGRSVIAKGARPLVNVKMGINIPDSITVLSAAAANQISQSYQDKGHGLFTYFLLKGLGREAAGGSVPDFKQAFDYAAPKVTQLAREEYNAQQEPQRQASR